MQYLGDLLRSKTPEKSQFDYLADARILHLKPMEGLFQKEKLVGFILPKDERFIEGQRVDTSAPLLSTMFPGVVDKNAPHDLGCDAEEVRSIAPIGLPLIHKFQIRFVYERRGLQEVITALAAHVS